MASKRTTPTGSRYCIYLPVIVYLQVHFHQKHKDMTGSFLIPPHTHFQPNTVADFPSCWPHGQWDVSKCLSFGRGRRWVSASRRSGRSSSCRHWVLPRRPAPCHTHPLRAEGKRAGLGGSGCQILSRCSKGAETVTERGLCSRDLRRVEW